VLLISIGTLVPKAAAQSDKYPNMAPVDRYLMERNAEILLARSAAPDSISSEARESQIGGGLSHFSHSKSDSAKKERPTLIVRNA
jgi:hypothetical protein